LPVGESLEVDTQYLPTLQLGDGAGNSQAVVKLEFSAAEGSPLQILGTFSYSVSLSIKQPTLEFTRLAEFSPQQLVSRGWRTRGRLAAAEDWLACFDSPWSKGRLDQPATLVVNLQGGKEPLRNVSVIRVQGEQRVPLQGQALRAWLAAGEFEVAVPVWLDRPFPAQPYAMTLVVKDAGWLAQPQPIKGQLPPLPMPATSPMGQAWLVVMLLMILTMVGIGLRTMLRHPTMAGELVAEGNVEAYGTSYPLHGRLIRVGNDRTKLGEGGIVLEAPAVLPYHADLVSSSIRAGTGTSVLPAVIARPGAETLVDGVKQLGSQAVVLRDGTSIQFGSVYLVYRIRSNEPSQAAAQAYPASSGSAVQTASGDVL
jgi:hypothetical protein